MAHYDCGGVASRCLGGMYGIQCDSWAMAIETLLCVRAREGGDCDIALLLVDSTAMELLGSQSRHATAMIRSIAS